MSPLDRGFRALTRHPWLMLLPLMWDVARIGLFYTGIPSGPTAPVINLGGQPSAVSARGFLPSVLPSAADLQLPLAPALQTPLLLAPTWMALVALVVIPLVDAVVTALYLGLLADAVAGRPLSWRRAAGHWPAFAALALATRFALFLLPMPVLLVGMLFGLLFLAVLPFAIGALGLPLLAAVKAAPDLFWGRFGKWFGVGLGAMLITFLATFFWTMSGASPLAALLVYPALATWLVGAAVAVCLPEEPEAAEDGAAPGWALPLVAVAAVGAAWLGSSWLAAWQGWYPSREAALSPPAAPPFNSFFPEQRHTVLRITPVTGGELVLSRTDEYTMSIAGLRHSRFGWQVANATVFPADPRSALPAQVQAQLAPFGSTWVVAGEIFDPRVAYLQIGTERYPVGEGGPLIWLRLDREPPAVITPLDEAGQPVPNREVKKP